MRSTYLVPFVMLAACGDDPVNYSAPVGIELKAKSGDVAQDAVTEQKDITTETSNPYGAFISDATAKLGNHAPGSIGLDQLTLTLGAQSTGVTTLEEVVTGDVDVAFLIDNSNNTYDAGHVMNPTGVGPVSLDPDFDWTMVASTDVAAILNGSFKVALRTPAAVGFATKGASASLQVTFTFAAFK
jgi:hypothetical protein